MSTKPKKSRRVYEELKVVVRKLPPTLTQEVFMRSVQAYKDSISFSYFVPGKNKEKFSKFGRAYLIFNTQEDKNRFMKSYKPIFIDEKGNKYMAKLEVALYQNNLKNAKVMPNPNEGTYTESEEYKAFLERLKNPKSAQVTTQLPDRKSSYVPEEKKIEKTPLVLEIERRLAEKREKEQAKRRKEREKESTKYAPKTYVVYQKKEK